jgi:hypothetical protein
MVSVTTQWGRGKLPNLHHHQEDQLHHHRSDPNKEKIFQI